GGSLGEREDGRADVAQRELGDGLQLAVGGVGDGEAGCRHVVWRSIGSVVYILEEGMHHRLGKVRHMQMLCGRLSRRRLAMARGRRLRSRGCSGLGRRAFRSGGEYSSMPASESEVLVGRRYLERGFLDAALR